MKKTEEVPCSPGGEESAGSGDAVGRVIAGLTGTSNLIFGSGRIAEGLAEDALSPAAGEAAPLVELYAGYQITKGGGQAISGLADLDYAFTGNQQAEVASNKALGLTTLSGLATLSLTGNWSAAATASSIENGVPNQTTATSIPQVVEAISALTEVGNQALNVNTCK